MSILKKLTTFISVFALFITLFATIGLSSEDQNQKNLNSGFDDAIRQEISSLQDVAAGLDSHHPLDQYRVLDQDLFTLSDEQLRNIDQENIEKLTISKLDEIASDEIGNIFDDNEKPAQILSLKPINVETNELGFLIQYDNHKLYQFRGDIEDVIFDGQYVMFLDKKGIDAESNKQFVYFIDLKRYQFSLGNTQLPVFKLPIELENGEPISKINRTFNKISLLDDNGGAIFKAKMSQIDELIDIQRIGFNLTVSLSDPATYEQTALLVGELTKNFLKASEAAVDGRINSLKTGATQGKIWKEFYNNINNNLKVQSKRKPKVKDEILQNNFSDKARKKLRKSAYDEDLPDDELAVKMKAFAKQESEEALEKIYVPEKIQLMLGNMKNSLVSQRKFYNRLRLLWTRLTLPKPLGASKIRDGLLDMVHIFSAKDHVLKKRYFSLGIRKMIHSRFIKTTITLSTLSLLGYGISHPEETAKFLYSTMGISKTYAQFAFGHVADTIGGTAYHAKESMSQITAGLKPSVLKSAYFSGDNFAKLKIGMTALATFIYTAIGTPHIIVNTNKLVRDLSKELIKNDNPLHIVQAAKKLKNVFAQQNYVTNPIRSGANITKTSLMAIKDVVFHPITSTKEFFSVVNQDRKRFVSAFIKREAEVEKNYQELLVMNEKERQEKLIGDITFTQEENDQIKKIIDMEVVKGEGGPIFRIGKRLKSVFHLVTLNRFAGTTKEVETFGKAFTHFLFSFASFTNSGIAYAKIWNSWFIFRSFVLRPVAATKLMLYPKLFRTVTNDSITPSKTNGAMLNRLEWIQLKKFYKQLDGEALKELAKAEEILLDAEVKLHDNAMKKSFVALGKYLKNQKDLQMITEVGFDLKNVGDKNIDKLSKKAQKFFHYYFDETLAESMKEYLKTVDIQIMNFDMRSFKTVKEVKAKLSSSAKTLEPLSDDDAKRIVQKVVSTNREIFEKCSKDADKFWEFSIKNLKILSSHKMFGKIAPQNNLQVNRFMQVERLLKDPGAMVRAVRQMIVGNIIDKPMELSFAFLFLAGQQILPGVDYDLFRPIQDSLWGPNSVFYLSREVFGVGFAYGVVSGVFADVWMKLQMDAQNENNFGKHIPRKFKEKGFLSYYAKQLVNPQNSWWKCQSHYIKIIWSNMPAAFVNMAAIGLIFRGRIDLDMYIVGYMFSYLTPISGITQKIEQTFELATDWYSRNFTRRMKASPVVQKHISKKIARARAIYNIPYKIYENFLGYFLGIFEQGANAVHGSRAMSRIIFFDYTPSELLASLMIKIKGSAVGGVPGVKRTCNAVLNLFLNNYTAWKHIKPGDLLD